MAEMGESSQIREAESRDIHTVCEQLVSREPSPLITVVGSEYEPESDPEEEEDPEEDPEEEESADGMGTTTNDIVEELVHRNEELEDRVTELEGRHQEEQGLTVQLGALVHHLLKRNAELADKLRVADHKVGSLQEKNENLKYDLREESAKQARAEDAWMTASHRAYVAEDKVRVKDAKIDEMRHVFHTALDRARDRVYHYPIQFEDSPWYVMDRRTMMRIMEEERQEAKRRRMF